MDLYKVAVFALVFLFSHGDGFGFRAARSAQRVSGEFQFERRGGGLLGLGLGGRKPGRISQGLHNLAGGVHNILHSAKETLKRPFSFEFNGQIGRRQNPNSPDTGNNYQQHYEIPNQNNNGYDDNPTNPSRPIQDNHRPHSSSQSDSESGEVHMYVENNFPVILLNENEIR